MDDSGALGTPQPRTRAITSGITAHARATITSSTSGPSVTRSAPAARFAVAGERLAGLLVRMQVARAPRPRE